MIFLLFFAVCSMQNPIKKLKYLRVTNYFIASLHHKKQA